MSGAERLRAHKQAATLRLDVGGGFTLRPVQTDPRRLDDAEVRALTEWRNRHVRSFLHEFAASDARTGRWLTGAVGPDDTRVLFMLYDEAGGLAGYLGLAYIDWARRHGEADAIVRGRELPPGTMKRALQHLLRWARTELGLLQLGVRVLADNPACEFYRKCGFVEVERQPLAARAVEDGQIWEPADATRATRWLVHFQYDAV